MTTTAFEPRPASRAEVSGLPLDVRLKRAVLFALILGLWAPFKIAWEQHIAAEQDQLRYHGIVITRQLRDQLGQGFSLGVLSGMGSVVADMIWIINVTLIWENQEWFKIASYINLCTTLEPRAVTFWDGGGWQLAWNASVGAAQDVHDRDPLRRLKASRFWIGRGLDVYQRGIANNPASWILRAHTALLYQQRLGDFRHAAEYYQQASDLPDAPAFYERFPAIMYHNAGDERASYAAWAALWNRLTPAERTQPLHRLAPWQLDMIEHQEQALGVPPEKRIFPK
jgi:tetratricopeptide (TPR) repeat protein